VRPRTTSRKVHSATQNHLKRPECKAVLVPLEIFLSWDLLVIQINVSVCSLLHAASIAVYIELLSKKAFVFCLHNIKIKKVGILFLKFIPENSERRLVI